MTTKNLRRRLALRQLGQRKATRCQYRNQHRGQFYPNGREIRNKIFKIALLVYLEEVTAAHDRAAIALGADLIFDHFLKIILKSSSGVVTPPLYLVNTCM